MQREYTFSLEHYVRLDGVINVDAVEASSDRSTLPIHF